MKKQKGQSLVEMAIILPILLIMFLGLIEIGWAIRGYMVLLGATRDAARFGVRSDQGNLVLSGDLLTVHNEYIQSYQVGFGDAPSFLDNSTVQYHVLEVYINDPCSGIGEFDYVLSSSSVPTYSLSVGVFRDSKVLNNSDLYDRLLQSEIEHRCMELSRSDIVEIPKTHSIFVVEAWYDQPTLLGFPAFEIVSGYVPLYVNTKMRLQ